MSVTLTYNGPFPNQSGGSIAQGTNVPAGGSNSTYLAPWIRFQPNAVLANGNIVCDLVMPGGPNNPQSWYLVSYTYSSGSGTIS